MTEGLTDCTSRWWYFAAVFITMGAGLLWRSQTVPLSAFLRKYGGDALWALLVYFGFRFLLAQRPIWWSACLAILFATAVEFSQLYHAPWLDGIRSMRLGHLILGSTYNWPDLPAYAVGIFIGAAIDWLVQRGRKVR